ncbi:sensor kinase [Burkholderia aenigmatica]|uniref:histidine kinase n=1 Tax=Burkholderia aenigmatica TaxID=2015348 RepID=A0ABY6XSH5_9BURK|nr:sensor kinase [Burkholderia aenigmatica]
MKNRLSSNFTSQNEPTLLWLTAGSPEAMVGNLYSMIDQIVVSVRRIAADLRPRMLDDLGLVPAVDWLIADFSSRYGMRVLRRIDANQIAFNRESATAVFRIVQEALTNSARHSGATEVTIGIRRDEPHCIVTIEDNGLGADSDVRPGLKSFGLLGMRERAERLGGELRIQTAPGHGFTVTIVMPLATVEADEPD